MVRGGVWDGARWETSRPLTNITPIKTTMREEMRKDIAGLGEELNVREGELEL